MVKKTIKFKGIEFEEVILGKLYCDKPYLKYRDKDGSYFYYQIADGVCSKCGQVVKK